MTNPYPTGDGFIGWKVGQEVPCSHDYPTYNDSDGNDRCDECDRVIRLDALAAHARGDFKAERIALDRLAIIHADPAAYCAHQIGQVDCGCGWHPSCVENISEELE